MPINYLEFEDVIGYYADIIDCTDQQALDHLRDPDGLMAALARPAFHAIYGAADLVLQAATLAHGIAERQAFIDGNKRLALVCMLAFLEINGYTVAATQPTRAG